LSSKRLRVIKPEIRVLGVDDGKFVPHSEGQVVVVGVVFRGGYWLEGVMSTMIAVDGFDATSQICSMITSSPHYRQLRVIFLNGVTFAGFNVVDIKELNSKTGLPVVAITQKRPNLSKVHLALNHLSRSDERWQAIVNAGDIFVVKVQRGRQQVYVEAVGITKEVVEEIIMLTSTRSNIPEALRVAHLVASGISHLE
jgi:uncharacterized protein